MASQGLGADQRFSELLCAWCFPVFAVLFGVGMVVGDFIPPPAAHLSAPAVAAFYADNSNAHRIGIVLISVGAVLLLPFAVAIASEVRRIEGPGSPMAYLALGAGTFTATVTMVYMYFLLTLTYRPDRSPDLIQLINDLTWVPFIGMWQPGSIWAAAVGIAVLRDRRPAAQRVFPRWAGWLSIWYAVTSLLEVLVPFFTSGPFAWHGFLSFYLGALAILAWWATLATLMIRGLRFNSARGLT